MMQIRMFLSYQMQLIKKLQKTRKNQLNSSYSKEKNKLEEILLNTQLKMQKAKNDLIKNLEKDMENVSELISIEEDLADVKGEMDEVNAFLDERIEIEKETLDIKAKE